MKKVIPCKNKSIFTTLMAAVTLINMMYPINARAQSNIEIIRQMELKEDIYEATKLIEEIFKKQYEEKEKELESIILEKKYDYTVTMETFYQNKNPFKDVDYVELIALYSTIKEYAQNKGTEIGIGLNGVQFLTMDIKEKSTEEKIPAVAEHYIEIEPGKFMREGNKFITQETNVGVFELSENGEYYIQTGWQKIEPVTVTYQYGEVTLQLIDREDIIKHFKLQEEDIAELYENTYRVLTYISKAEAMRQSVFVQTPKGMELSKEAYEAIKSALGVSNDEQINLIDTAVSLIGQVPYQWGGKARMKGYDNSWWLYEEGGEQRGLDCSGFVQWVFMTAGYEKEMTDHLISTSAILEYGENITYEELRPGDLGLLNLGESINHVGIYIGDGYFIHCSSGKKTVVVDKFGFRYFKRVLFFEEKVDNEGKSEYSINYTDSIIDENDMPFVNYEDGEIELLAQLIHHEAGNQGYNGKVAVAEVVRNRLRRKELGYQSVTEVIYASGQFQDVEEIKDIQPLEEEYSIAWMVLEGRLSLFGNEDVLFFKNPMITDGIPASEVVNWGKYKYYGYVVDHAFYTL